MAAFDRWVECTRKIRAGQAVDLSLAARQVFNELKVDQEFLWAVRALKQRSLTDVGDDGAVEPSAVFALLALADPFAKPYVIVRQVDSMQLTGDRVPLESAALVALSLIASRCGSMEDLLRHFEAAVRRLVAAHHAALAATEPIPAVQQFVYEAIGLQRSAMMHRSFEDPMESLATLAIHRAPEDPIDPLEDHPQQSDTPSAELPLQEICPNRRNSDAPSCAQPETVKAGPAKLLEAAGIVLDMLARLPGSQASKMVAQEAQHFRHLSRIGQLQPGINSPWVNDAFYVLLRCAARLDRTDPTAMEDFLVSPAVRDLFYGPSVSALDVNRRPSLAQQRMRRPTLSETSSFGTQPGWSPKSAARPDNGSELASSSPGQRLLLIIDDDAAYSDSEPTPTRLTARTQARVMQDARLSPKSGVAQPGQLQGGDTSNGETVVCSLEVPTLEDASHREPAPAQAQAHRSSRYTHLTLGEDEGTEARKTLNGGATAAPVGDRAPEGCTGGCCVAM